MNSLCSELQGARRRYRSTSFPENRTELGRAGGDNSRIRYDVRGTEKLVQSALVELGQSSHARGGADIS